MCLVEGTRPPVHAGGLRASVAADSFALVGPGGVLPTRNVQRPMPLAERG